MDDGMRNVSGMNHEEGPWYRDGLAFECTRCGACCTGTPGYVWVDIDQIGRLAEFRGESIDEFASRFVRQVGMRYSLNERPNGECVFWDAAERGCSVYPARPSQCRSWPFWDQNLAAPEAWAKTSDVCPGVGRGTVVPMEELEAAARRAFP